MKFHSLFCPDKKSLGYYGYNVDSARHFTVAWLQRKVNTILTSVCTTQIHSQIKYDFYVSG